MLPSLGLIVALSLVTAVNVPSALRQGAFDNLAQARSDPAVPRVQVTIIPTSRADWSLWQVHVATDAQTSYDQTWAMLLQQESDGSASLVPYYQLRQETAPSAKDFDPSQWLSLEACAYRGSFTAAKVQGMAEGEPCVAVSMSVGARRALLPVGFTLEPDDLLLEFNFAGKRTDIDARPVH
jgi:hypothetical protein